MSDDLGDQRHVRQDLVPPEVLEPMLRKHSQERPRLPFAWMVSYSAEGALQNMRYFENAVRHCRLEFPIRVWFSHWTDAIVVSFVPLEAIREAHVLEWFVTFYEVPFDEARQRLTEHPKFPYDGRNPDTVRAAMLVDGDIQALLKRSRTVLAAKGIEVPPKW